jgi:hypothetical protein
MQAPDGSAVPLVHGEVCPEKVIVTESGETKLLGFGFASVLDRVSQTQAGDFKGKVRGIPPEQLRGEKANRRFDIYSAGVMLCEGLTGQSLWGELGNLEITSRLARNELASVPEFVAALPGDLREVCTRATDPQPENRYSTALEFKRALLDCAHQHDLLVAHTDLAEYVEAMFTAGREQIERMAEGRRLEGEGPRPGVPEMVTLAPVEELKATTPEAITSPAAQSIAGSERRQVGGELTSPAARADLPVRPPETVGRRRRLPAVLIGAAAAIPVIAFAVARFGTTPVAPGQGGAPAAGTPMASPVPAQAHPPGVVRAEEKAVLGAAPVAEGQGQAPEDPPRATPVPSRQRHLAHRRVASGPPPPPAAEVRPAVGPTVEQPHRWNGRSLDLDNPYPAGSPASLQPARARRTIDPSNPWSSGDTR